MGNRALPFLPYGRQSVDEADIAAVAEVLRGDWLTTGPTVSAFEDAFAARTGAHHAVSCSSGTAALHLGALALGLGEGDWVIVPTMTFAATANAARFVGSEVLFADVDPDTGLMTPNTLDAALIRAKREAKPVRAVLPVHLGGQCCAMGAIGEIARDKGLAVVEDACHAVGGDGVGACAHSAMATFSLHPVKTIAAGEGGVVATNDGALAETLQRLRSHGMVRDAKAFEHRDLAFDADGTTNPWYYEIADLGFNYRLSDIHAALALSQLGKLDQFVARRQALAKRYDAALADLAPAIRPVGRVAGPAPAWHLYVVLIDFERLGMSRAKVMARLRTKGVGTQVHYVPVHRQPYYVARYGAAALPGAEAYYERALSLPLFPAMTDDDVDRVVAALADLAGGRA